MRTHTFLALLFATFMLTGFAVAQAQVAQPTPAVDDQAKLSDAVLREMVKNLADPRTLDDALTDLLGLTKGGSRLTIPYLTCQDNLNTYHGFYRLPGTAGYLFARKGEKGLALWRLDLKLDLVVALFKPEGQAPFITNVPSAMKSLRVEFDTWRVWERTIRTPTPVP